MSKPKVEVVAHSIGPNGIPIFSLLCEYPRIIHGELMTHRLFSRNASSSRAVPFKTMIKNIKNNLFVPYQFQKRHKGMQGSSVFTGWREKVCRTLWEISAEAVFECANMMDRVGITKQLTNRITEPFSNIKVLITSTEWSNFLALRDHPDAEIHIQALAREMKKAMDASTPKVLKEGEWHLPFIRDEERDEYDQDTLLKISVARSARTSYLNNYGKNDINADMKLYEQLIVNDPKHASPCEHQAKCIDTGDLTQFGMIRYAEETTGVECRITMNDCDIWSGNLRGWLQYRKTIRGEHIQ